MKTGTGLAIFILFFGVSLIEALQAKNWPLAFLFFALGAIFFYSDQKKSS